MPKVNIFDAVLDLRGLRNFRKLVEEGGRLSSGNPIQKGLFTAAFAYFTYLRDRFIQGIPPALAKSTIKRKRRRGIAKNPRAILRETDTLLEGLAVWQESNIIYIGYREGEAHPTFEGTIKGLATIHQEIGVNQFTRITRPIVVDPPGEVQDRMQDFIRGGLSEAARQANKANRR